MRISDWSSECALPICSNGRGASLHDKHFQFVGLALDCLFRLHCVPRRRCAVTRNGPRKERGDCDSGASLLGRAAAGAAGGEPAKLWPQPPVPPERPGKGAARRGVGADARSEEHTSELQSLMRISYAVFCLKKKNIYE